MEPGSGRLEKYDFPNPILRFANTLGNVNFGGSDLEPDSGLKFEVVTKGDITDLEVVSDSGGNNLTAEIKGNFSGGSLTSVDIIKPGKGYSAKIRPQLVVVNVNEETIETTKNEAKR